MQESPNWTGTGLFSRGGVWLVTGMTKLRLDIGELLLYVAIILALATHGFLAFLNADPLHDGWFLAPAVEVASSDTSWFYRDVLTPYGFVTPALQSILVEIFGVQLLPSRLAAFFLTVLTAIVLAKALSIHLSLRTSLILVLAHLLISLGQLTKSPDSAALGMWPNSLMLPVFLFGYVAILKWERWHPALLATAALAVASLPWIRAQGALFSIIWIIGFLALHRNKRLPKTTALVFTLWAAVTLAPLVWVSWIGALDDFFWQTVLMPATREWVGMPNPADWVFEFGGATLLVGGGIYVIGYLLSRVTARKSRGEVGFQVASIISLATIGLVWLLAESSLFSAEGNFLRLFSETYVFAAPSMALAFLMLVLLPSLAIRLRRHLILEDVIVYSLLASTITLVYYNFFHIIGLLPVLLLAAVHFKEDFRKPDIGSATVITWVTCGLAAVSLIQTFQLVSRDFYPYSSGILTGMFGTEENRVEQIDSNFAALSGVPHDEEIFFDCGSPLYSLANGAYMSDNLFYSNIMSEFERRAEIYQMPADGTRYWVTCDPKRASSVNGPDWSPLGDVEDPHLDVVIYERSDK